MEKEEGEKHQCEQCGKSYVFKHKLAHHKTWLCKEVPPKLVELKPRRKLSSNVFHLATIPEREDGGEDEFASERVSKPQVQGEGAGTIASKRVSKPQNQAGAIICDRCKQPFPTESAARNHWRRHCKSMVEVISLYDF